ncbi:MAG: HAMP domain-containing histidine kinase [Lachnospiraceae bacterium]|nr:HAMP domain-containing histidine kinase [Lachnospiraceae bacterium]
MEKQEKHRRRQLGRMSRRAFALYLLNLLLFVIVYTAVLYVGYVLVHLHVWQGDETVYLLLGLAWEYIFHISVVIIAIGALIITHHFLVRPYRYLNEVVGATKQMAYEQEKPVTLSAPLVDVENEMNLIRETSINNARYAKEAEQRKNDLIVYLAHDLKTPLTSVIGYLTLLRDEEQISDELRQKYLAISLDKAERLEELINEFFEITRFNLTQIALEYSRVNLTLLLEQLIFEFRPMLAENDLTCRLNAAPDIQIFCDADKIQRVFDNLLKNAVNYSYEGTEIVIMVEQDPRGSVTITFVNHGNTISESKLKRIFEQFYRLDTARSSKSGGAGLGLAISKQIVETHGGTIRAESADELIVFTVELPSEPRMAAPGPETESAGA